MNFILFGLLFAPLTRQILQRKESGGLGAQPPFANFADSFGAWTGLPGFEATSALIIRMGLGGIVSYNFNKEPPK